MFYFRGSKFGVWEVKREGGETVVGTQTVLDKKAGADQSGKLVSLNNSALN